MRNLIYLRPTLYDLSQGSKIKFIRVVRHLNQDNISEDLGIIGEKKRRILTRYEKGERNLCQSRLKELSKILLVNERLIKQYEFKNISDILYFLLWLEEMFLKIRIDLRTNSKMINLFFDKWNTMRDKKIFMTQFGRICEELNIVLETTSIATAKANVERENGTFKNRLIAELRHVGITIIDETNEYLNNIFIPKMNKRMRLYRRRIKINNFREICKNNR